MVPKEVVLQLNSLCPVRIRYSVKYLSEFLTKAVLTQQQGEDGIRDSEGVSPTELSFLGMQVLNGFPQS